MYMLGLTGTPPSHHGSCLTYNGNHVVYHIVFHVELLYHVYIPLWTRILCPHAPVPSANCFKRELFN